MDLVTHKARTGAIRLLAGAAIAAVLAGCASTGARGVEVVHAQPVALDRATPIQVDPGDRQAAWAARAALKEAGWPVVETAQPGSVRLRTHVERGTVSRLAQPDPFCDRGGWHPRGWTPYSHWGGFYGPCRTVRQTYPVRTLTWAVESMDGRVLWYASAREAWPAGPPLALSRKLTQGLNAWQARVLEGYP